MGKSRTPPIGWPRRAPGVRRRHVRSGLEPHPRNVPFVGRQTITPPARSTSVIRPGAVRDESNPSNAQVRGLSAYSQALDDSVRSGNARRIHVQLAGNVLAQGIRSRHSSLIDRTNRSRCSPVATGPKKPDRSAAPARSRREAAPADGRRLRRFDRRRVPRTCESPESANVRESAVP